MWSKPHAVALVVLALFAGACARSGEQAVAPPVAPPPLRSSVTAVPTPDIGLPTGITDVVTYFVRDARARLWVEPEVHTLAQPTTGVATAAMQQLMAGDVLDPSLSTLAPPGTRLLGATLASRLLTIDLSAEARNGGGSAAEEAFQQQLAYTGAQFDTIDAVLVLIEGQPISELWGHLDWSAPLVPDEFALSPIIIDQPRWQTLIPPGDIAVSGTANTFEANIELQLIDPTGAVVQETFTTASCGSGCRGEWSHTFSDVTALGRWEVVARESDASGGEGPGPFETTLAFVVTRP